LTAWTLAPAAGSAIRRTESDVSLIRTMFENPVAAAFVIIVLGTLLGRLQIKGISLGSSGVLFVALICGQFNMVAAKDIKALGDFGVVLFVYAIGLQAGPSFLRTVRSKGIAPMVVAFMTVVGGAVVTGVLGLVIGLDPSLIVGIFAGALTSTPALAAATEVAGDPQVSVAYGVAYPFGVIGVVLFAQIVPKWIANHASNGDRQADAPPSEPVHQRCFLVQNPGCVGKRVSDLRLHDIASVNVSRICRGEKILPSSSDVELQSGDILMAVGSSRELDRLTLIIGPPVPAEIEMSEVPHVIARDIFITENNFAGYTLQELHVRTKYNVVLTRVKREDVEFVPRGRFRLEMGDQVRAVGYEPDVKAFMAAAGVHAKRIHETGIAAFAVGLVLGLLLGFTPITLPGGGTIRLGLAGGPLFMGILLGHFGRIGRLRVHVPAAARYLMREIGLVLFLVSAGTSAGSELMHILAEQGLSLVIVSVVAVVVSVVIGFGGAYWIFKQSVASTMGMTCGAMTSTPGLGAVSAQFDSDVPSLSYAAVYPVALIAMTVVAQLMLSLMQ